MLQTPAHAVSVSVPNNKCAFSHPRVVHKDIIGDKLMADYSSSILEFQVWNIKVATAIPNIPLPLEHEVKTLPSTIYSSLGLMCHLSYG